MVYRVFSSEQQYESDKDLQTKKVVMREIGDIDEGEKFMIKSALNTFKNRYQFVDKIQIFTDSRVAMDTLPDDQDFQKLINYFEKRLIEVELIKVKAHSGRSLLNDFADKLAKLTGNFLRNYDDYVDKKKFLGWTYN